MNFFVGQRVVCVDDRNRGTKADPRLVRGGIYHIARVTAEGRGVWVEELPEHPSYLGYHADRFRPIIERKTDISVFTAILNPSTQKVDA